MNKQNHVMIFLKLNFKVIRRLVRKVDFGGAKSRLLCRIFHPEKWMKKIDF